MSGKLGRQAMRPVAGTTLALFSPFCRHVPKPRTQIPFEDNSAINQGCLTWEHAAHLCEDVRQGLTDSSR